MTRDDLMAFCTAVLSRCDGDAEVCARDHRQALLRFANNQPIQHTDAATQEVRLRLRDGARYGEAQAGELELTAVDGLLARARQQMAVMPPDPEPLESAGPQALLGVTAWQADSTPAVFDAEARASAADALIAPARELGFKAAGICSAQSTVVAMATTRGMRGAYAATEVELDVTADADGSTGRGSGWSRRAAALHPERLGQVAAETALRGRAPRPLAPGRYRVVLSAQATAELLWHLVSGFNARAVNEGRSWLSGRLATAVAAPCIQLRQDITHRDLQGRPFDDDGLALRTVDLIRDGVACGLLHDRRTAAMAGVEPTGFGHGGLALAGAGASAPVMAGEERSEEELLAACGEGLYLSRLWYTNWVDPRECVVTGMTRDGVFHVREGRLAEPLTNARFNQNLLDMLRGVVALGRAEVTDGVVAPAMVVDGFTISSATTF